jgi:Domain of unknown function (DUF6285)
MNDRPTAAELLDAVRHFLETDLLPSLSDARLRFQTLIAANVLAVAGRELATEKEHLREEWSLLGGAELPADPRLAVEERNRNLCARIRAGDFDEPTAFRSLASTLRQLVLRKLEVANPRYVTAR